MPDRQQLRVGDRIRLLRVPPADLAQREREHREGLDDAGLTADTIERILAFDPVVTISWIDEYGQPWYEVVLPTPDGEGDHHCLAVMEDESWEHVM